MTRKAIFFLCPHGASACTYVHGATCAPGPVSYNQTAARPATRLPVTRGPLVNHPHLTMPAPPRGHAHSRTTAGGTAARSQGFRSWRSFLKSFWSVCVGCLFLRSPSRVPYRTELLPRAPNGGVPGPPTRNPCPRHRSCPGHNLPRSWSLGGARPR